ncbi:MAG: hypothetical protein HC850_17945 [Rhodomicrobium sp.]|nr:hypothetical protein [Rhodomicrobium sp.]
MSNLTQPWKPSRDFEPSAECWRSFAWSGGSFDTARRPMTRSVEGRINLCHPTVIAVLGGGCSRIEIKSECGHHYRGADFTGSVSFIPESCARHLKMTDVQTEWASFSIGRIFPWRRRAG